VQKWTKADMPENRRPSGTVHPTQYSATDLTPTAQGRFYVGAGGAQAPPNVCQAPPNILVPKTKKRIVKI